MTREQIMTDLYSRLTSRKLWLCLLMLFLAVLGYRTGNLDYWQFQSACLVAVGVFSGAEALVGAAAALKPKTATEPEALIERIAGLPTDDQRLIATELAQRAERAARVQAVRRLPEVS